MPPPVFINPCNRLGMATLTIFQDYLGAMVGNSNGLGDAARMKSQGIFDTFHRLPNQVVGQIIVRQVAIDAFYVLMGAGVKPGLIFRLQHMATAAKLGTFGFGIEAGRSKGDKYPQNRGDCRRNQYNDQDFSLGKAQYSPGAGRRASR